MKRQNTHPKYSVAELFCGCGGFSHGFWRTGRFQTVLGNDVKKFALQTFKLNHSHDGQDPAVIEKILAHRGEPTSTPPVARARAPDDFDDPYDA